MFSLISQLFLAACFTSKPAATTTTVDILKKLEHTTLEDNLNGLGLVTRVQEESGTKELPRIKPIVFERHKNNTSMENLRAALDADLLQSPMNANDSQVKESNLTALKGSRRISSINCPLKDPAGNWMHCHDLITPFLMGIRTNITNVKLTTLDTKGREVFRFLFLLKFNSNTREIHPDEMQSNLIMIAKYKIRLHQWTVNAIKLLLDAITKEKDHNFANLKAGIKRILAGWAMDYSDHKLLLDATTIIKPPCITYVEFHGGTKQLGAVGYSKATKPSKPPKECDSVCMARMARTEPTAKSQHKKNQDD